MTWGEFKKKVEALGLKDEHELWYIDWTREDDPIVYLDQPPGTEPLGAIIR